MGVHGATKCMKKVLFVFNLFFFLLGCGLIGLGVWGELTLGDYVTLTEIKFITGPRIILAAGVGIAVMSFFGCCGAYKENKCMLTLYVTLLIVLLGLEIAVAVLAFKNQDEVKNQLEKDMKKTIQEYPHKNKKPMDDLQSKYECCGTWCYRDWKLNSGYNRTDIITVPDSCCKKAGQDCGKNTNATEIFSAGCFSKFRDAIQMNLKPVGGVAIAMFALQVLGIIFGIVLIIKID